MITSAIVASMVILNQQKPVDNGSKWMGTKAKSEIVNDENGKPVDLSKLFGKRPIVLVFYRGVW